VVPGTLSAAAAIMLVAPASHRRLRETAMVPSTRLLGDQCFL
jgi:hypothetical protein